VRIEAEIDTDLSLQKLVVRPAGIYGPYSAPKECSLTFRGEHGSETVRVSIAELQQALRAVLEAR
jgi:hypothetical protein